MEKIINQLHKLQEQERANREAMIEIANRRRQLIRLLSEGGMSYDKIGAIYGISRQRIEQIMNRGKQ